MVLLLTDEDVRKALPLTECMPEAIAAVERATRIQGEGRATIEPRISLKYEPAQGRGRTLVVLAGIVEEMGGGVRTYATLARDDSDPSPRQTRPYGGTVLFDYDDMAMLAMVEDGYVNVIRTGAPTGVAVRHLSNPDASDVAIIGSGELAPGQLAAVCAVRTVRRVRVFSRTPEHCRRFASEMSELLEMEVAACGSAREAVEGAEIVVTVTSSFQPVLERGWLARGATLVSVAPGEIDAQTVLESRVFTESRVRCLEDPTRQPFATLVRQGRIGPDDVTELGDVLTGQAAGRTDPNELITFISAGSAVWDVAVPAVAYRRARELGLGEVWP